MFCPASAGIWFLPTAVLLYTSKKSGKHPSQINHWHFLQTRAHKACGRGAGSIITAEDLTRLMCSCLFPLMLSAITAWQSCDLSCKKSPDTRRRHCSYTTPLSLKMSGWVHCDHYGPGVWEITIYIFLYWLWSAEIPSQTHYKYMPIFFHHHLVSFRISSAGLCNLLR